MIGIWGLNKKIVHRRVRNLTTGQVAMSSSVLYKEVKHSTRCPTHCSAAKEVAYRAIGQCTIWDLQYCRSQHIFVDPEDQGNVFKSTYNCVACYDNQKTLNDGYHILHHINSQTHWSELPQRFIDTWDLHASNRGKASLCLQAYRLMVTKIVWNFLFSRPIWVEAWLRPKDIHAWI